MGFFPRQLLVSLSYCDEHFQGSLYFCAWHHQPALRGLHQLACPLHGVSGPCRLLRHLWYSPGRSLGVRFPVGEPLVCHILPTWLSPNSLTLEGLGWDPCNPSPSAWSVLNFWWELAGSWVKTPSSTPDPPLRPLGWGYRCSRSLHAPRAMSPARPSGAVGSPREPLLPTV